MTRICFWTPIKYENQSTSFGQKIRECADSYFYLGGRVAVVISGVIENGSTGVTVREEQSSRLKTALKVASYCIVILPVLMFAIKVISRAFYSFHECQGPLPGTQKTEVVVNNVLPQKIDTQGMPTVFLNPTLLLTNAYFKEENIVLNFAEVIHAGQKIIVPVQAPYPRGVGDSQSYILYPGSPNEALLKMAQGNDTFFCGLTAGQHWGSPIKFILKKQNNNLTEKGFLDYLLKPSANGTLPLHTIDRDSLLETLELAKSYNIAIDLKIIDPGTKETLFSKWAGTGDVEITRNLLDIDPSVIRQPESQKESVFMKAVLRGFTEEAQMLWQAMKAQNIEPTQTDQWGQKACMNNCDFTDEQFLLLPIELQQKVFKIANININKKILYKLRDLGMHQPPAQPKGAALFSYNMDAIYVEETLKNFLLNLRKDGLLLTKKEFAQKDSAQYCDKGYDIGRVLGRNYIEQTARRLHLPYIKVPKKIAVIQPQNEQDLTLEFTVAASMKVECSSLQIYAEKIEPIKRYATREEMIGLLDLIVATGFNDFFGINLFMGKNHNKEEGIFFIDTEYRNFSSSFPHQIAMLLGQLHCPEDHSWFKEKLQRRLNFFGLQSDASNKALQEARKQREPELIGHGFRDRCIPFIFNIAELIAQEIRH